MRITVVLMALALLASCQSKKDKLADEIKTGEAKLFNDSVKMLNTVTANQVYQKYILFADTYKEDTASAAYLFKAADLANGLRRPKESVQIYERLRTTYPTYRKSAAALFMEAFLYETAIEDKEMAKTKYKEFIDKYPTHQLVPSAQASLDQLNQNLTDEELIRRFEAQQGK
jgi:outer membrane protein assembly factor BamD (BamD/ComL family)